MQDVAAVLAPDALAGRTAWVSGAGSGIGRAIATTLGAKGAHVWCLGRRPDPLAESVELIAAAGGRADWISVDVREPNQVEGAIDRIVESDGRIDHVVNNAGGQYMSPAEQISEKGFRSVTRLNLDAVWRVTTRIAERCMIPAGYGKVVSITMTPRRGMYGMAHSSSARAGVESLTSTWAQEWGSKGIRTVAIAPGVVETAAWKEKYGLDPAVVASVIPLARLQRPEEVAALAAFLLSPAGDYITGQTIVADGGWELVGPVQSIMRSGT